MTSQDTSTPASVLDLVRHAFASAARPEHFTHHEHCDECAEHDRTLASFDPETLPFKAVRNPCWCPIVFMTDAAFRYYLPGLARLALDPNNDFAREFLHHLTRERVRSFDHDQRVATVALLEFIRDEVLTPDQYYEVGKNLEARIRQLQGVQIRCDFE